MAKAVRFLVPFAIGLVIGVAIPITLYCLPAQPRRYQLTSDLDSDAVFYFGPEKPSLQGVVLAGSVFEIEFRKGEACYVSFGTVVDAERLASMSVPVDGSPPILFASTKNIQ